MGLLPDDYIKPGKQKLRYTRQEADFICEQAAEDKNIKEITVALEASGISLTIRTEASVDYFIRRKLRKFKDDAEYEAYFTKREEAEDTNP